MKITIPNHLFENIIKTLNKARKAPIDGLTQLKFKRIEQALIDVYTPYAELLQELRKEHIEIEGGQFKVNKETNEFVFKSEKDKEAFQQKYIELANGKSEVETKLIEESDLGKLTLTGNEIDYLSFVIEGEATVSEKKKKKIVEPKENKNG